VLAVTSLGVFVVLLDTTIVNIAFPAITTAFPSTTRAALSWVLNAYAIVFAALLITAGRLADQLGRRRVFLTGLALFAVTSAACGLAPTLPALVAGRALQAVGAALLVPTSLALLLAEFPRGRRSMAVGLWGAVGAVAAASGPLLGALLVETAGWRWIFLANLPVCVLAITAGRRLLAESTDPQAFGLPDLVGVALVIAATALGALGIVQGPDWGWTSPRVAGTLLAAVALAALFVRRTRRATRPVVDLALFGVRSFRIANLGTLLFATAFFAIGLGNVLFLTGPWQWSVLHAAAAILPAPLTVALVAGPAGRLADRIGHAAVIVPGALVFAAGQLWFATQVGPTPAYLREWLPGLLLGGLGIGLALPTLGSAAAATLPAAHYALGSAVNATARQLGAVLGVSLLIAVLGTPAPGRAMAAFDRTWAAIGTLSLAAAITSLALRRPSSTHHPATPHEAGTDLGPAASDQGALRPREPVPAEPEHPAGPRSEPRWTGTDHRIPISVADATPHDRGDEVA
jgi:EmrB/QacA subfamily drug resistance transporter